MTDEMIGKRFGRLTVLRLSHKDRWYKRNYVCRCDCGNETIVLGRNLTTGNTTSCGCFKKEVIEKGANLKHAMRKTRLYSIWAGIRKRIRNERDISFENYGGRGIKVCDEWSDFANFAKWALENGYCANLTIDRIDVNGDYAPDNCRWATIKQQQRNKRNNNLITYNGETKCATEWEQVLGYNKGLIYARQSLGWDIDRIMTTPPRKAH